MIELENALGVQLAKADRCDPVLKDTLFNVELWGCRCQDSEAIQLHNELFLRPDFNSIVRLIRKHDPNATILVVPGRVVFGAFTTAYECSLPNHTDEERLAHACLKMLKDVYPKGLDTGGTL